MNIIVIGINDGNPSGVVRYQEMILKIRYLNPEFNMVLLTFDTTLRICTYEKSDGLLKISLPLVFGVDIMKENPEVLRMYYDSCYLIIKDLLKFDNRENFFHVQEFFLINFAIFLKGKIGGAIILHVHVIPWKLMYENSENLYTNFYRQILDKEFRYLKSNMIESFAYKMCDHIICVTDNGKNHVCDVYDIDPSKVSVIFNGLKDEFFSSIFSKTIRIAPCRTERTDLIFVGRATREKGFFYLVEALQILYDNNIVPRLDVFGDFSVELKNMLSAKYSHLNIILHGKVNYDILLSYYEKSPIGIIPSIHEQCSYAAIEMAMFGLPIIVSDIDGLSEMFEDGISALKVPLRFDYDLGLDYSAKRLADCIAYFLDNRSAREIIGNGARQRYLSFFTLEKMLNKLSILYKSFE